MSKDNNGKLAERAVQQVLNHLSSEVFDWQRMYDATSARGAFMAQTGDFQFFTPACHGVIEVKSTAHPYRLAKKAFSDGQRVKLKRRMDAGGKVYAVVWHHTENVWRVVPYAGLHKAFDEDGAASADLTSVPTHATAAQAVVALLSEAV
ncbi:hypothetical protein V9W64_10540 [Neisseria leonii]|uniref:Uncharacterized protein n=1 Tax=Neisseria leonii TaxID=2995413 RepID=A0A9X4IBC0_9NEIS|nr:hypothetical protein [Neisseria sp. 51.81]MDD9328239.1 hypothetical protein [Neisseria sp. 51.81]